MMNPSTGLVSLASMREQPTTTQLYNYPCRQAPLGTRPNDSNRQVRKKQTLSKREYCYGCIKNGRLCDRQVSCVPGLKRNLETERPRGACIKSNKVCISSANPLISFPRLFGTSQKNRRGGEIKSPLHD